MNNFDMLNAIDACSISMSARIPQSLKSSLIEGAKHGKKGVRYYKRFCLDFYYMKVKPMIEALEYFGYKIEDRTDMENIYILINFKNEDYKLC